MGRRKRGGKVEEVSLALWTIFRFSNDLADESYGPSETPVMNNPERGRG